MNVTEKAQTKIEQFLKTEGALFFRTKVTTGGCSGFSYEFLVEKDSSDDDEVTKLAYGSLLIDAQSKTFLNDTTLDYVDEIGQSGFIVINPDVKSVCGCGISFDI